MKGDILGKIKSGKPFGFLDAVIILSLLLLGTALLLTLSGERGVSAEVYSKGKLVKTIDLLIDAEYTVESDGHYNIISVSGGKLSVKEADCLDQICVYFGEISKKGQSIICLPHDFIVIITSGEDRGVDAET